MVNLGSIALVAAMSAGQVGDASNQLQALQPLIGQWVYV